MKKLLALALAVVMMMAIALPAFAAAAEADPIYSDRAGEGNDDSSKDNYLSDAADEWTDNDVLIKYGVAQAYTVTIPEAINLHEYKGDSTATQTKGYVYSLQNVKIEDVVIAPTEEINVYLKSYNQSIRGGDNKVWYLMDTTENKDDNRVNYAVSTSAFMPGEISGLENNGKILTCAVARGNNGTTGSSAETNLYFSSKGTAQEGTYTDVLTFTVKVEAVVVNP